MINKLQRKTGLQQIFIGVIALLLGVMIYLLDRPAEQTYFIPDKLGWHDGTIAVFGVLGNHLPTFLHVFAFCLITCGALTCSPRGATVICIIWMVVDSAFEFGQHATVAQFIIPIIPNWFTYIPVLENTQSYFAEGHFDMLDLLSIVLGSLCAYVIIRKMQKR